MRITPESRIVLRNGLQMERRNLSEKEQAKVKERLKRIAKKSKYPLGLSWGQNYEHNYKKGKMMRPTTYI